MQNTKRETNEMDLIYKDATAPSQETSYFITCTYEQDKWFALVKAVTTYEGHNKPFVCYLPLHGINKSRRRAKVQAISNIYNYVMPDN